MSAEPEVIAALRARHGNGIHKPGGFRVSSILAAYDALRADRDALAARAEKALASLALADNAAFEAVELWEADKDKHVGYGIRLTSKHIDDARAALAPDDAGVRDA